MDSDLDEIEDLPRFNNSMLPDTLQRYCYKSYRNQPDMIYERDSKDPGVISLKRLDSELAIPDVEVMDIPVLGDVVAGSPLTVNEEIKEYFALPLSWMIQPKNTFMLEVVGDSMKDAGIDVGDYVIVNKQSTADNGQIVIALLDDEATLKRYMQMGDSVLLIPENSRYEPINLSPDQVQINGIVIGLLKKL
jgi:DNA helicase-2/ATP-dependent DNA helicase PcrA